MTICDIKKVINELEYALADSDNVILDKYKSIVKEMCRYENHLVKIGQDSICGFGSNDIDIANIKAKMRYITRCVFESIYNINCDESEFMNDYPDLLLYINFMYVFMCRDAYEKDLKHDQQRAVNRKKNKHYVMFYVDGNETSFRVKKEIARRFVMRDNEWILRMALDVKVYIIGEKDKDPGKYLARDDEYDFYHCIIKTGGTNPFQYAVEYKAAIVVHMVPLKDKNNFFDLMKIFEVNKEDIKEIKQIIHDTNWVSQLQDQDVYYNVEPQPKDRTW